MKVLVLSLLVMASQAFGYQPLTCEEVSSDFDRDWSELVETKNSRLAFCESLTENAQVRCIETALATFDQGVAYLHGHYQVLFDTCLP